MEKYVHVSAELDFYEQILKTENTNIENRERELFSLKDTAKFRMTTTQFLYYCERKLTETKNTNSRNQLYIALKRHISFAWC